MLAIFCKQQCDEAEFDKAIIDQTPKMTELKYNPVISCGKCVAVSSVSMQKKEANCHELTRPCSDPFSSSLWSRN